MSDPAVDISDSASGSSAFFFGFASDAGINGVVLNFGVLGDPNFLFNAAVDDVTLFDKSDADPRGGAVPELSSLVLLGLAGMAGMALTATQRRLRRRSATAACALRGGLSSAGSAWAGDHSFVGEIICEICDFAPGGPCACLWGHLADRPEHCVVHLVGLHLWRQWHEQLPVARPFAPGHATL